jgi:formylglycine-generating enzyme required for sulfatase activity
MIRECVVFVLMMALVSSRASEVLCQGAAVSQPAAGSHQSAAFGPTVPNKKAAPVPTLEGMAWIPGGEFSMGAMDPPAASQIGMHQAADARPVHRVYVDGFWMDKTDVTNEQFARFVRATNYVLLQSGSHPRKSFRVLRPRIWLLARWFFRRPKLPSR